MKANRKFIEGDERAVSAVIGVILMVAITVAIAATVYVYVSGMIGGTQKSGPKISWVPDVSTHTLQITKGAVGFPYCGTATSANLIFRTGSTDYHVTSTYALATGIPTAGQTKDIMAGDIITTPLTTTTTYTMIWVPTNEVLGSVTF
jgi:flagellin-like protein